MKASKHRRAGRDVPHPDPDGAARAVSQRKNKTFHGSASRSMNAGDVRGRVPGTNGSWPREEPDRPPRPPVICALYHDWAEDELPTAIFGQYPKALIGKILPWLRCQRDEILHVCSGALPPGEGIRVDIRPDARPDILADGRMLPLADGAVAAVMIDPPYTKQYARDLYSVEYPLPSHLLAEAARVVRPGGRIAFVHYIVPITPPGCAFVTVKGLSTGFGYPMRAVTLFERDHGGLFAAEVTLPEPRS